MLITALSYIASFTWACTVGAFLGILGISINVLNILKATIKEKTRISVKYQHWHIQKYKTRLMASYLEHYLVTSRNKHTDRSHLLPYTLTSRVSQKKDSGFFSVIAMYICLSVAAFPLILLYGATQGIIRGFVQCRDYLLQRL